MPYTKDEVLTAWNCCHDFGEVISGEFPTKEQTFRANYERRLEIEDSYYQGFLKIEGENECFINWSVNK